MLTKAPPVALGVADAPETESYYIPLVTRTSANTVLIPFDKSVDSTKTSGFDSLLSDYFPSNVFNLTVHATHQIYDVVHVFGTDDKAMIPFKTKLSPKLYISQQLASKLKTTLS